MSCFALGNGDQHGLYWPIGQEAGAPIFCEMFHDEWTLNPHSSSIEGFLQHVADGREWDEGEAQLGFEDAAVGVTLGELRTLRPLPTSESTGASDA